MTKLNFAEDMFLAGLSQSNHSCPISLWSEKVSDMSSHSPESSFSGGGRHRPRPAGTLLALLAASTSRVDALVCPRAPVADRIHCQGNARHKLNMEASERRFSRSGTSRQSFARESCAGIFSLIAGIHLSPVEPTLALDPKRKLEELYRIWSQEEADEKLGELASPEGGKTIQPVLTLIPIVRLQLIIGEVETMLKDEQRWDDVSKVLSNDDFSKKSVKRVFNAYSDNIYYLPGSGRENKYLQGGATPTTRQSLQYLLRNDIIDNLEGLSAEIDYLLRERAGEDGGAKGKGQALDTGDLWMYLSNVKVGFDRYLGMVFTSEIDEAKAYAKMALASNPPPGLVGGRQ